MLWEHLPGYNDVFLTFLSWQRTVTDLLRYQTYLCMCLFIYYFFPVVEPSCWTCTPGCRWRSRCVQCTETGTYHLNLTAPQMSLVFSFLTCKCARLHQSAVSPGSDFWKSSIFKSQEHYSSNSLSMLDFLLNESNFNLKKSNTNSINMDIYLGKYLIFKISTQLKR